MGAYAAVAIGGVIGCWARYALSARFPFAGTDFPSATLAINVAGSFLIGFLFVLFAEKYAMAPALRAGVLSGALGGFTTFSTFSMETLLLLQRGAVAKAVLYVAASVLLGLAAAYAGVLLARQ